MTHKNKLNRCSKLYSFICILIMISIFFVPLIQINGMNISILRFVTQGIQYGGPDSYAYYLESILLYQLSPTFKILYYLLSVYLIIPIIYCIYLSGRIFNKEMYTLEISVHIVNAFFAISIIMISAETIFIWHPAIIMILSMIEFMGRKLIEDIKPKEPKPQRQSVKEKNQRENALLYKVIIKNWAANRKNFIIFFSSSVVTSMLTFISIAATKILMGMHSEMRASMTGGLIDILKMAIVIIAIVNIFLMKSSTQFYVKSRLKDYGMLLVLGIRERTLKIIVIIEYVSSLLAALFIGVMLGMPCVYGTRLFINVYGGAKSVLGDIDTMTVLISAFICCLIFAAAFLLNKDVIWGMALSGTMTAEQSAERRPLTGQKRNSLIGLIVSVITIYLFGKRLFYENIYLLFIFCIGIYFIFYWGCSLVLSKLKTKQSWYYRNNLTVNNFYHRYKSNVVHMFSLFILDFFILFYLTTQTLGAIPNNPVETNYPYSCVSMFETLEKSYFEELEKNYDAQISIEPMVRLTVADITPRREDPVLTMQIPQGQQIGISETTYNRLNHSELDLKGKEIFISYQQIKGENAHPVDFSRLSKVPGLHAGLPIAYDYTQRVQTFPNNYVIQGEERNLLFGHLQDGYQENVIVFSDEYFNKIQERANGPKYIALIRCPQPVRTEIVASLEQYSQNHIVQNEETDAFGYHYDSEIRPVYNTEVNVKDEKSESMLKLVVNILAFLALFFATWFIQFMKYASDREYFKRKGEFLKCIGMRKKEIEKTVLGELGITRIFSIGPGIVFSLIFTYITLHVRFYSAEEMLFHFRYYVIIILAYILLECFMLFGMYKAVLKMYVGRAVI